MSSRRTIRHLALGPVGALVLSMQACSGAPQAAAPKPRPAPMVIVSASERRDVPVEVHAPVDLRPLEQSDVGSKVLGYVDAVLVDRGDRVRRGQVLALVRPSDLPDQLAAARGTLAQAQSSLALARVNRDRAKLLAPTGVMSQQELQQAEAAVTSAEASSEATQAQLGSIGVRLGETRIESPLDGVVAVRRLDPGALVGPPGGGAILTIVRIDRLRVFVTANERDAMRVQLGQDAHVELDGLPGQSFSGKVVRIAPTFDPGTRTLEAEVQLDNPGGRLRPGMYGYGSIQIDMHASATVVPSSAVQFSGEKKYVFVLDHEHDNNVVLRTPIETGVDAGPWIEVTAGLRPGQDVVTAGADGLADHAKVRVTRDTSPYTGLKVALDRPASTARPTGSGQN